MFEYNQENGFSIMNFVMAGICLLLLLAPIACIIRERQMTNLRTKGCDWISLRKTNVITPRTDPTLSATN